MAILATITTINDKMETISLEGDDVDKIEEKT